MLIMCCGEPPGNGTGFSLGKFGATELGLTSCKVSPCSTEPIHTNTKPNRVCTLEQMQDVYCLRRVRHVPNFELHGSPSGPGVLA